MGSRIEELEAGNRRVLSELGTAPLPIEPNISPEYFELERERIFKRVWLNVGRVEEVAKPGSYFVKELPLLNTSLLIACGKDGVIRGFHNMCKHRGNKIVKTCRGTANGFACGFHGWTYDLEGKLIYVPQAEQFVDLKTSEYGLTPVATDVWEGFIFIHLDPHPAQTLREFLGEFGEAFHGYPFAAMQRRATWTADVKVNWKIFEDAFFEGYHVPYVHRRSTAKAATRIEKAIARLKVPTRFFKLHRISTILANPNFVATPSATIARKEGGVSLTGYTGTREALDTLPPGINPERREDWNGDLVEVFPNIFMAVTNNWYITYNFWPLEIDQTRFEVNYYFEPPKNAGARIAQEYAIALNRVVLREDLSTMESVQSMQRSGAMTSMPLCGLELRVRAFRRAVQVYLGDS